MGVFRSIAQLFGRGGPSSDEDELAWLNPPADVLDGAAWDQYWKGCVENGLGPPFIDMFCNDRPLVAAMQQESLSSVLCAGNGISMEPRALAAAGLSVTALDLSAAGLEVAKRFPPSDAHLANFIDLSMLAEGGSVEFVVGDVLNAACCPGPFDLIIERRTAQNYATSAMADFLQALAERLSENGVFLSHCHDAAWRPGDEARHATSSWFDDERWPRWEGDGPKPKGRVFWRVQSTG